MLCGHPDSRCNVCTCTLQVSLKESVATHCTSVSLLESCFSCIGISSALRAGTSCCHSARFRCSPFNRPLIWPAVAQSSSLHLMPHKTTCQLLVVVSSVSFLVVSRAFVPVFSRVDTRFARETHTFPQVERARFARSLTVSPSVWRYLGVPKELRQPSLDFMASARWDHFPLINTSPPLCHLSCRIRRHRGELGEHRCHRQVVSQGFRQCHHVSCTVLDPLRKRAHESGDPSHPVHHVFACGRSTCKRTVHEPQTVRDRPQ